MIAGNKYGFATVHSALLLSAFFSFILILKGSLTVSFPLMGSVIFLLLSALIGDFKGLFVATALSSAFLLWKDLSVFQQMSPFLFFLLWFNTGLMAAIFKKNDLEIKHCEEQELIRLKAWEHHYGVFRQECLEQVSELKEAHHQMMYADLELQSLKQEKREAFLEENEELQTLIGLLEETQQKCRCLEKEVELLEELVAISASAGEGAKAPRRKKKYEEMSQPLLF